VKIGEGMRWRVKVSNAFLTRESETKLRPFVNFKCIEL